MKGFLVALLSFGASCSCSPAPVKEADTADTEAPGANTRPDKAPVQEAFKGPRAFAYRGDFYPSFMPSCALVIQTKEGAGRVKLTVFNNRDTARTAVFSDSAALNQADVRAFFSALAGVPLLHLATKQSQGLDGITVHNVVVQDGLHNQFTFWSPRQKGAPQEHQLVAAVLGVGRRKFTSLQQQEYFESLEQYFDFGLPCRVTRTTPFEVRMYGNLSSSEEAALTAFVHALPTNRPVLIDVTNFNSMGTMFYPLFQGLLSRNPSIVWVASPNTHAREQLHEIGVPDSRTDTTLAGGRNLIKRLSATQD